MNANRREMTFNPTNNNISRKRTAKTEMQEINRSLSVTQSCSTNGNGGNGADNTDIVKRESEVNQEIKLGPKELGRLLLEIEKKQRIPKSKLVSMLYPGISKRRRNY